MLEIPCQPGIASRIRPEHVGIKPIMVYITVILFFPLQPAWGGDDHLVLLDGSSLNTSISAINAAGTVSHGKTSTAVPLMGLRNITRDHPKIAATKLSIQVQLSGDGGVLNAIDVRIVGKECAVTWAHGQPTKLPLPQVAGIAFSAAKTQPAAASQYTAALREPIAADRIVAILKGKVKIVSGVVTGIDAKNVSFIFAGKSRTIARTKIYGIILAGTAKPTSRRGQVKISLTDGSRIWGKLDRLQKNRLSLIVGTSGTALSFPWENVTRVDIWSDRMDFLSDLTPTSVSEETLISFPASWQGNRTILNRPLRLDGTVYEKGLGVHSRSELTYAAGGQYKQFAAMIGIDAETLGKGDCIFRVVADGKEVFRQRMRGTDKPFSLQLDITGVESVTLAVEYGEELDLADHADWCDARFIR